MTDSPPQESPGKGPDHNRPCAMSDNRSHHTIDRSSNTGPHRCSLMLLRSLLLSRGPRKIFLDIKYHNVGYFPNLVHQRTFSVKT
jgi:hypothetical protein